MTPTSLEQRVEQLERIVAELQTEALFAPGRDNWRATIGAFSSDAQAQEILDAALQLRETERRQLAS